MKDGYQVVARRGVDRANLWAIAIGIEPEGSSALEGCGGRVVLEDQPAI